MRKGNIQIQSNNIIYNMLIFVHVVKAKGMKAGFTKPPAKLLCATPALGAANIYYKLSLISTFYLRGFSPAPRTMSQPQGPGVLQDELSLF